MWYYKAIIFYHKTSVTALSALNFLSTILFHCHFQGRIKDGLPIFFNHLCLCNHFEELQTVLFDVELIISNVPLTYIYPNIIETCLTPNHLLFGRHFIVF